MWRCSSVDVSMSMAIRWNSSIFVFRCPAVVVAELRHDTFPVVPVVVDVTAGCIVSISTYFVGKGQTTLNPFRSGLLRTRQRIWDGLLPE